MSSVNKVILVGFLGADPELKYTQEKRPVCKLSVATNYSFTDRSNMRQERVNWHKVVIWGRTAEVCKQHLRKGSQVYVEGRLENRSYEDKEGTRRFTTEVVGTTVRFLGRRPGAEQPRFAGAQQQEQGRVDYGAQAYPAAAAGADDLPF